ncbi:MAG: 3-isopropylmalate dehydratase small subunit [Sphingomicrobium sp.]
MKPVSIIYGTAYPLGLDDVDTDMIISAEWLKTVSRKGLGKGAFAALRSGGGSVFDDPIYRHSPIIIAGRNFGCGSSREHAVWALLDMGVKAVIASGFSDIFAGNAYKNGVLAIALEEQAISDLVVTDRGQSITIDLANQSVVIASGKLFTFEFDAFRKKCLLNGMDEIELTEQSADNIARFEMDAVRNRPFLANASR